MYPVVCCWAHVTNGNTWMLYCIVLYCYPYSANALYTRTGPIKHSKSKLVLLLNKRISHINNKSSTRRCMNCWFLFDYIVSYIGIISFFTEAYGRRWYSPGNTLISKDKPQVVMNHKMKHALSFLWQRGPYLHIFKLTSVSYVHKSAIHHRMDLFTTFFIFEGGIVKPPALSLFGTMLLNDT